MCVLSKVSLAFFVLAFTCVPCAVLAQGTTAPAPVAAVDAAAPPAAPPAAPTADEVNRVVAYFLRGAAAGPVLMESTLCQKTEKIDGKLACAQKLPATIKKGDTIIAFVKFFVPKGGKYDDVKVRFLLGGEVRSTSDFTLSEAWTGYSNYKQTTAAKAGAWEVQVLRGDVVLSSQTVTVQ